MASEKVSKILGELVTAFAVLQHRSNYYRLFPFDEDSRRIAQAKAEIKKLELLLKKRSSKRRRVSPKGKQSNFRKADVARSAKRRKE